MRVTDRMQKKDKTLISDLIVLLNMYLYSFTECFIFCKIQESSSTRSSSDLVFFKFTVDMNYEY